MAGVCFLHDNAWFTIDLLNSFVWDVLNHSSYSPDLVPSDFLSIFQIKNVLAGQLTERSRICLKFDKEVGERDFQKGHKNVDSSVSKMYRTIQKNNSIYL